MIPYEAILNKAKSMGFSNICKDEHCTLSVNGKVWTPWLCSPKDDDPRWGVPVFLLTCGNKIRIANNDEIFDIMLYEGEEND